MDDLLQALEEMKRQIATLSATMLGQNKLAYTTAELASALGTYPSRINLLRYNGALTGIRNGQEWIYAREEAEAFLIRFRGMDLSSEVKVIEALRSIRNSETIRAQKKPTGGTRKAKMN